MGTLEKFCNITKEEEEEDLHKVCVLELIPLCVPLSWCRLTLLS